MSNLEDRSVSKSNSCSNITDVQDQPTRRDREEITRTQDQSSRVVSEAQDSQHPQNTNREHGTKSNADVGKQDDSDEADTPKSSKNEYESAEDWCKAGRENVMSKGRGDAEDDEDDESDEDDDGHDGSDDFDDYGPSEYSELGWVKREQLE